jgi:hypothetical protein
VVEVAVHGADIPSNGPALKRVRRPQALVGIDHAGFLEAAL